MTAPSQRGSDYYSKSLSGKRLQRCYDIAPPRVRQYLTAEIDYTLGHLASDATVLELGCGYGRVLRPIAERVTRILGIDTSHDSLQLAREYLTGLTNVRLICSNAVRMSLRDESVDVVVGIQNGISAFGVDPIALVCESVRVTRPGGRIIISTYSERFWPHRLEWFKRQANAELIGPIDWEQTQ
ncbi:MAG: methyltransferase domain-containing protein, partial [candidate division Zixibacteria bacterium]|nr:methyltransferase domain-containing protein [candidate division Zixibacteria bacterium]